MQVDDAGGQRGQNHRKVGTAGAVSTRLHSQSLMSQFLVTDLPARSLRSHLFPRAAIKMQCLFRWMSPYGWGCVGKQRPRCGTFMSSPLAFPD